MTKIVAVDYEAGKALFGADDNVGVIVDINKRDVVDKCKLDEALTAAGWMKVAPDLDHPAVWRELAEAAVTAIDVVEKEAQPAERRFRVPDAVKKEAQRGLDWAVGFERGNSHLSMGMAKLLIEETYVPLSKLQRISKYFSRRPVTILSTMGWSDGQQGFPTDDRIKYSMWGGEAAREWVTKITNKHPALMSAPMLDGPVMDEVAKEVAYAPYVDGDGDVDPNGPHEFIIDPDIEDCCIVCGREQDAPQHEGMVAGAFKYEDAYDYFGKGEDPDSTVCSELYRMDGSDNWSMYDGTGWVDIEAPTEDTVIIMLDPESAETLANFIADRDPDAQGLGMELALINPAEAAMFSAAEAEIDWDLVQAVFDIYDSQERSVNAKKQVRGPGGKFGDQPDSPDAEKQTEQPTKARLTQALPLVPDITARISQYLADVARKRGTPVETPTERHDGLPGGETSIQESPDAEFNWVEDVGGLPHYIKRIEKHLREKGMTESHAIATAVNAAQKMCDTGDTNFPGKQDVNAGSRAEACKAIAEWNEKKARAHANSVQSTELTAAAPAAVTDVRPLYMAIVDSVDTEAVLDLISLVPPAAGTQDDVVCWKRDKGAWVQASDILADLRGVTPPPVVELTDDAMLTNVIEQVDKATSGEDQPENTEQPTSPEPAKPDANPDQHPVPAVTASLHARHRLESLTASGDTCTEHPCQCNGCDTFDCGLDGCACCWVFNEDDELVPDVRHPVVTASAPAATWTWTSGSTANVIYTTNTTASANTTTNINTFSLTQPKTYCDEFENVSADRRDKFAKKGYALPDGSYPIPDVDHLKKAIQAYGRAKNKELAKKHIKKRARALNRYDLIPDDWKSSENSTQEYALWGPHGELINFAAEGGVDQNRGNAEKLRHYWERGEGAAKVMWNTPGDWYRCVSLLSKYMNERAKGYCTLRHKAVTGVYPGQEHSDG